MTAPTRYPALLLSLGLSVLLGIPALAQPAALSTTGAAPLESIEVLRLSPLNNAELLARDAAVATSARTATDDIAAPLKFAEGVEVEATTQSHGTWETLSDGTRVWRLVVESSGAYSLNFGFRRFRLPAGAQLWIYPAGGTPEYRPFTSDDNEEHGELWTPIVPGDRAVIEVDFADAKPGAESDFELELGRVSHAYRPAFLGSEEVETIEGVMDKGTQSGSCNVDVVCSQGDPYRDIIRSVGHYTINLTGGTFVCTGTAINNTANDGKPLFLTANHCSVHEAPSSIVVYWNFQNSTCRTPGSTSSGQTGNGPRTQFNTGTIFRGRGEASDWAMIELDDPINPAHNVLLAGWDRRNQVASRAIAIHHPSGHEKRISLENDPLTMTTYNSSTVNANGTHLRIADWDLGTTEGGSSGSALFSPEQRIIGQLHGGSAACGNNLSDWYGRLAYSFVNPVTSGASLATLLDPSNTGVQTVDSRESSGTTNPPPGPTRTFASTTPVGIPDNTCPNLQGTATFIPLEVSGGFVPTSLAVGVQIQHTFRSDLGVLIQSPSGTQRLLMFNKGAAADNLNATFADDGPVGAFNSGNHDLGGVPFAVRGQAEGGLLTPLAGTSAEGVWTLLVCDGVSGDVGQLKQWNLVFTAAGGTDAEPGAPAFDDLTIEGIRPNPSSDGASLQFAVRRAQTVRAELYDATGRRVAMLFDGPAASGTFHVVRVATEGLPPGTYFVRLTGDVATAVRPLVVLR